MVRSMRFYFVILLSLMLTATVFGQQHTRKLVPLKIKYPKPQFIDFTHYWDIPNLSDPFKNETPTILVPIGTENVALGKPVSASDERLAIGELSMLTDGDKEGSDGHYLELNEHTQWIQVDLGAEYKIYAIALWHYHKHPCVYFDVVVQASNDINFDRGVKTLFNNDDDNSSFLGYGKDKNYVETYKGKLIDAHGVKARYVRCYSNGNNQNDLNHYVELEVYGIPVR